MDWTEVDSALHRRPGSSYYLRMNADMQPVDLGVGDEYVELAAEVFALLADPTRIRIVLALRDGELPVNRLAEIVGKSPTAVSQHLAKLRWAKVVRARQDGTYAYYSLIDEHARRLVTDAVYQAEHVVDEVPAHHRAAARASSS
jgi:DNA-binding transcriptional ArsR family regulator